MGFIPGLPESDTVTGTSFLMVSYGYILLQGANLISDGSELLLEVLDPGIIGGLVLPVLGAVPDAAIILMSGLGGTVEEAQEQVAVGMGTLAGSTIMLLTIAWAGSLWLGRCDLITTDDGRVVAKNKTLGVYNGQYDLYRTGVTTDTATRQTSWTMLLSSLLYLIIQIPAFTGHTKDPQAAYIAFFLALASLALYCVYQVVSPDLQKKKIQKARTQFMRIQAIGELNRLASEQGNQLLNPDLTLNLAAATQLFNSFDDDQNGTLDASEVKGLLIGLSLNFGGKSICESSHPDEVAKLQQELDKDGDGQVTLDEFTTCLQQWIGHKMAAAAEMRVCVSQQRLSMTPDRGVHERLLADAEAEQDEEDNNNEVEEEEAPEPMTPMQIYRKATLKLVAGTTLIVVFADPMVDAVSAFAKATSLPPFFVSFIITPFASNASELVSSLTFAAKKKKRNISLTYSQVYGAVTMNNTMCFAVFMALVAFRGLAWTFSAEVTVTLLAIWALSFVATRSLTFKLWLAIPVMCIYPGSIALAAFLEYGLGWQ